MACLLTMILSACAGSAPYRHCGGAVWATTYSITYQSDRCLDDSILAVMKQVEMSLSPFESVSVISRINRSETDQADSLVRRIFLASQEVNRLSHGMFDPTVSPLINLWGFGYKTSTDSAPDQARIDSALTLVGIGRCRLDGNTIVKPSARSEFNFSAITKGYGCDLIGEMLRRNGCDNYMVEIGGEIALSGANPSGDKWNIQIDAPIEEADGVNHNRMAVVELTDCGVATSGNYRNFHATADGTKAWHTISPITGRPAETNTLSATIVAPTCMMADALATACMAMPEADARAMIESLDGVSALLVVARGQEMKLITIGNQLSLK